MFLARSIAQRGKVILLDEPFTGVDVNTEKKIITLLGELKEEGSTWWFQRITLPPYPNIVIIPFW